MKRKLRLPPGLSSSTSVPRMSDGIRSGVNWMRRPSRPRTVPMVSTSLVLARPGTPTSRAWPPESTVIKARSTTMSWPKITAPMAALAALTCLAVDSAARTIISSSFSRLSPLADAMIFGPLFSSAFGLLKGYATNAPRRILLRGYCRICLNLGTSLRYLPPPDGMSHKVANRLKAGRLSRDNNGEGRAERTRRNCGGAAARKRTAAYTPVEFRPFAAIST